MNTVLVEAFVGGMLIGLGAILLMLTNGRIAGISGIVASAFGKLPDIRSELWRWSFLLGLIIAPLLLLPFGYNLPSSLPVNFLTLSVAGLLVGLGTQMGSGCTSGHGICGIGRLSKRSITATLTFMLVAICTVAIVNLI